MEAQRLSAVRQAAMMFAIGLAIYAQHAVHQRPDDTMSWLVLPIVAIVAGAATGYEPLRSAMATAAPAHQPTAAQRVALGVLAVAAIAGTTYLATTRQQ